MVASDLETVTHEEQGRRRQDRAQSRTLLGHSVPEFRELQRQLGE
jgi:hypothetical protein